MRNKSICPQKDMYANINFITTDKSHKLKKSNVYELVNHQQKSISINCNMNLSIKRNELLILTTT